MIMTQSSIPEQFLKLKKYKPTYCIDVEYTLLDFLIEYEEFSKLVKSKTISL